MKRRKIRKNYEPRPVESRLFFLEDNFVEVIHRGLCIADLYLFYKVGNLFVYGSRHTVLLALFDDIAVENVNLCLFASVKALQSAGADVSETLADYCYKELCDFVKPRRIGNEQEIII